MPYINSVRDLSNALREGRFTSLGSYPIFYLTSDGATLDPRTVKKNFRQIAQAIKDKDNTGGWRVVAYDVNWEDPEMYDADTGERIESAYAEDEAGGSRDENPMPALWGRFTP